MTSGLLLWIGRFCGGHFKSWNVAILKNGMCGGHFKSWTVVILKNGMAPGLLLWIRSFFFVENFEENVLHENRVESFE